MRSLILAAASALLFATAAQGAPVTTPQPPPAGPYKLDASGRCHAANGAFVVAQLCITAASGPYRLDANGRCHAANGHFVATSLCPAVPAGPYKLDAKGKCHAANGQFVATALCKPH